MDQFEHTARPLELSHLLTISSIVTNTLEWKPALEEIVRLTRSILIYDNLVVYLYSENLASLEVVYARAAGRGRSAGAEMSWGEGIANQVLQESRLISYEPPVMQGQSRLEQPFILGIPLTIGNKRIGAFILIRFGGPHYTESDIELATFISQQIALLMERQSLQEEYLRLEEQQRQYRLQDDFVSTITHELRNPLGFIKGYTTTLLRSDTQWEQSTQTEFLNIIDQETDRLQELIENLLDSARLQSGVMRMQFQPVRVDTVLNDVIMRARLHHTDLVITLRSETPTPTVRADPTRLAQVFENVINNSIKYAPGSEILVTIKQMDAAVIVDMQDFGQGIPEDYLPLIFDRFFRAPDAPNIHGSGLGLYICRQIVTAHKGQISASSKVGAGTTITIQLPVSA